jgi:hydroxylamine reductase (hybrid-cluster protein)
LTKKKSLFEYIETPGFGYQLKYGAVIVAILKLSGNVQNIEWGPIAAAWAFGLIWQLLTAAFKRDTWDVTQKDIKRVVALSPLMRLKRND